MKDRSNNWNSERGVSVIEMLVVVVIIGVVAALAIMRMDGANPKFKRQNVARELKVAFERARFDSVKRHAEGAGPATVIVDVDSYTLKTDLNQNGTFETAESVVTNFAAQNITIAGPGNLVIDFPVTVTFDKRGKSAAVDSEGSPVDPQFNVCNGACPSIPTMRMLTLSWLLVQGR